MISHKHKCIFIHIPKTAGTSINTFFHPGVRFHYEKADYERLFGWCPKRRIHMQHATSKQLIETELITEEQWNTYFKFAFVRNPWDRAYSDYIWIQQFSGVKGSFKDYILKNGNFKGILNDSSNNKYLGDHLYKQSDFFDVKGDYEVDFIGRFENFNLDIQYVLSELGITEKFNEFQNKGKGRKKVYSTFYTNTLKKLVTKEFEKDIRLFNYTFEDNRKGIHLLKKLF